VHQALALWRSSHILHTALRLAGKRCSQGQLNTLAPSLLLHITCAASQLRFLVDTGTAFSVYKGQQQLQADLPCLRAAGGQTIPCFSEFKLTVQFGQHSFNWTFLLADVEAPLLGADFLCNYSLLVDLHECLVDATTLQRFGNGTGGSRVGHVQCGAQHPG
jgi:hypothetical protein